MRLQNFQSQSHDTAAKIMPLKKVALAAFSLVLLPSAYCGQMCVQAQLLRVRASVSQRASKFQTAIKKSLSAHPRKVRIMGAAVVALMVYAAVKKVRNAQTSAAKKPTKTVIVREDPHDNVHIDGLHERPLLRQPANTVFAEVVQKQLVQLMLEERTSQTLFSGTPFTRFTVTLGVSPVIWLTYEPESQGSRSVPIVTKYNLTYLEDALWYPVHFELRCSASRQPLVAQLSAQKLIEPNNHVSLHDQPYDVVRHVVMRGSELKKELKLLESSLVEFEEQKHPSDLALVACELAAFYCSDTKASVHLLPRELIFIKNKFHSEQNLKFPLTGMLDESIAQEVTGKKYPACILGTTPSAQAAAEESEKKGSEASKKESLLPGKDDNKKEPPLQIFMINMVNFSGLLSNAHYTVDYKFTALIDTTIEEKIKAAAVHLLAPTLGVKMEDGHLFTQAPRSFSGSLQISGRHAEHLLSKSTMLCSTLNVEKEGAIRGVGSYYNCTLAFRISDKEIIDTKIVFCRMLLPSGTTNDALRRRDNFRIALNSILGSLKLQDPTFICR